MVYETKLEDGGLIKKSINILLQHKKTPWYLVRYIHLLFLSPKT